MRRAVQSDRSHGIDSVVLHLGVERSGLHLQETRSLSLIAAAVAERAHDQLNLVPLNLAVKIDALVIEHDLLVAVAIGGEFFL